ncbi:MAG: TolC family protein [Phycisphaerae bacterium]|nr:TolC family protein [Phycisphaerae bacterium]
MRLISRDPLRGTAVSAVAMFTLRWRLPGGRAHAGPARPRVRRLFTTGAYLAGLAMLVLGAGCQTTESAIDETQVDRYEERMAAEPFEPAASLSQIDVRPPVALEGHVQAADLELDDTVWLHLPDPSVAPEVLDKRLETTRYGEESIRREYEQIYENTKRDIKQIERPKQFRLMLSDALRRALAHNYEIKVEGYAPAISTAQIVQAEAAFDVAFFANVSRNNTDQPTPSQLMASQTDTTVVSGGIRKLLATGAAVTLTEAMTRVDSPGFAFQTLNPWWGHSFAAELRQPLMRNFGIDLTRSQINIRKNERLANLESFRAKVIEILNRTEEAYWTLVAARRNVVISAELLAQANLTYSQIQARVDYDAYQTLLYRSEATVKQRESEYIDVRNQVRNAEDQLLNLMNDPELPLSAGYEIIPVDNPTTIKVLRDRFHAVETALQRRPEIKQARHGVDIARLQLGIAKNQALPQLDVVWKMTVSGLGANSDRAWDQMTGGNFTDQYVGVEFLWNFGERAERAGIRIATLEQSKAVVTYKRLLDLVITDCGVALRNIETNFEQIGPTYEGVKAASENLRSLQERQERKSPAELDTTLNAQTALAQSRRALLQAIIQYNQGIVDVERAKGTLLEYNNVVLAEEP